MAGAADEPARTARCRAGRAREPVSRSSRSTTPRIRARCQAKRRGHERARGEQLGQRREQLAAQPAQRQQSAVEAHQRRGVIEPVQAHPGRIAAPAEWPTATAGSTRPSVSSSAPRRLPPCRAATGGRAGGGPVKPCPGRSGATTVNRCGQQRRQPAPGVGGCTRAVDQQHHRPAPITCTCQRKPPALDEAAGLRGSGQSRPRPRSQAGGRPHARGSRPLAPPRAPPATGRAASACGSGR